MHPHVDVASTLATLVDQVGSIIVGKRVQVEDCVACLMAGGHLLIEDLPGVGKTTLAQALARSLGLQYARVQFTADMMPSDLLGASIWRRQDETFVFHPGPVFTQVLLADEINRAGPRTQGALLEAMEEAQVSVDAATRPLPRPFFVIATQNPRDQHGTYPLPQGQLDRFLMCITLGLPDRAAERALLAGEDRRAALQHLKPVLDADALQAAQQAVQQVHVSEALLDYVQALVAATREGPWFAAGLSPRGALALLRVARARALMAGRGHVVPEDVQSVFPQVLAHRLEPAPGSAFGARAQALALLQATPV
jgi:MoxR-like ATPase